MPVSRLRSASQSLSMQPYYYPDSTLSNGRGKLSAESWIIIACIFYELISVKQTIKKRIKTGLVYNCCLRNTNPVIAVIIICEKRKQAELMRASFHSAYLSFTLFLLPHFCFQSFIVQSLVQLPGRIILSSDARSVAYYLRSSPDCLFFIPKYSLPSTAAMAVTPRQSRLFSGISRFNCPDSAGQDHLDTRYQQDVVRRSQQPFQVEEDRSSWLTLKPVGMPASRKVRMTILDSLRCAV